MSPANRPAFRLAGLALAAGTLALASAAPLLAARAPAGDIAFSVYRDGSPLGRHEVRFRRDGGDLHVNIEIELEVKLAFLTLFRYSHRNHEIWRDGRLVSLETRTDDDGTAYRVSGRATGEGFLVEGAEGRLLLPAAVIPTSYWNPATLAQTALLDTQKGRLREVAVREIGPETIDAGGQGAPATRYRMTGDLELDLWYSPQGEWMRIAFEAKGATVDYSRRHDPGRQSARLDSPAGA